jgi:hypothetical protein
MKQPAHIWIRTVAMVALLGAMTTQSVTAQGADTLVLMLESRDWQVRASAVDDLHRLPLAQLPPGAGERLIALLEREAVSPDAESTGEGEGYGEYLLALVRAVRRLNEPHSLRGMALYGIRIGRAYQDFVASFGAAALAPLDEAWQRASDDRTAIFLTWGRMLGPFGDRLSPNDRLEVETRLSSALVGDGDTLAGEALGIWWLKTWGFAWAADAGSLWEVLPVLERIAGDTLYADASDDLWNITARLRPLRDAATSSMLASRLAGWTAALCRSPSGPRRGACESLGLLLNVAEDHLRAGRTIPAANAIDAYLGRANSAYRSGAVSRLEHALIAGQARYLLSGLDRR